MRPLRLSRLDDKSLGSICQSSRYVASLCEENSLVWRLKLLRLFRADETEIITSITSLKDLYIQYSDRLNNMKRYSVPYVTSLTDVALHQLFLNQSLLGAVLNSQIDIVRILVSLGVDTNGEYGETIERAAQMGNLSVLKLLIAAGANAHINYEGPLMAAVGRENIDIVRYLLSPPINADPNASEALLEIDDSMEELIHEGTADPLTLAVDTGNRPLVELLLSYGARTLSPHRIVALAVGTGDIELVEIALDNGGDIRGDDDDAFKVAINNKRFDILRLLLDRYEEQ